MAKTELQIQSELAAQRLVYDSQLAELDALNKSQRSQLSSARDTALQDAYLTARAARRDLPQQLAAGGRHGGLAETSEVSLQTNYENARAALDQSYAEKLAELEGQYLRERSSVSSRIAALKAKAEAEIAALKAAEMTAKTGAASRAKSAAKKSETEKETKQGATLLSKWLGR